MREIGLTAPQLLVLQTIRETPSASVSDIARLVSLSQATVTSILDRLEVAKSGHASTKRGGQTQSPGQYNSRGSPSFERHPHAASKALSEPPGKARKLGKSNDHCITSEGGAPDGRRGYRCFTLARRRKAGPRSRRPLTSRAPLALSCLLSGSGFQATFEDASFFSWVLEGGHSRQDLN